MSQNQLGQSQKNTSAHRATKRVIPRYFRRFSVKYQQNNGSGMSKRGFSRDVGPMGLQILSNRKERVGDRLFLEVTIPDRGVIRLEAQIRWIRWVQPSLQAVSTPCFGVQITNAPEDWFTYFMELDGAA